MGCPELRCFAVVLERGDFGLSHHLFPDYNLEPQSATSSLGYSSDRPCHGFVTFHDDRTLAIVGEGAWHSRPERANLKSQIVTSNRAERIERSILLIRGHKVMLDPSCFS